MTDREMVIKAFEICYTLEHNCTECPLFTEDDCNDKLMHDALTLLKDQEPKLVEIDGQLGGIKYGRCPKCGKGLNEEVYPHWCGFCGQAVKWK